MAIWGYLLLFCESKKPDTGGVFWIQATEQLFLVLAIYVPWTTGQGNGSESAVVVVVGGGGGGVGVGVGVVVVVVVLLLFSYIHVWINGWISTRLLKTDFCWQGAKRSAMLILVGDSLGEPKSTKFALICTLLHIECRRNPNLCRLNI